MITLDDTVSDEFLPIYESLFKDSRLNPNGCPIRGTFYVSHNGTDYNLVRKLYEQGHEIASHSLSHRYPQSYWTHQTSAEWKNEMNGQRRNIATSASIPLPEIRGMRAPFLETGGDAQFSMMKDSGFLYDATFMTGPHAEGGAWPFTLDYPPTVQFCSNNNCPKSSWPGIWEVPINRWIYHKTGEACSMTDFCATQPADEVEALSYFWHNFNRFYQGNRAPLGIHFHANWLLKSNGILEALNSFIDSLLDKNDVYFVTAYQVIEWIRQPQSVNKASLFKPWQRSCGKLSKKNHSPLPLNAQRTIIEKDDTIESYTPKLFNNKLSQNEPNFETKTYENYYDVNTEESDKESKLNDKRLSPNHEKDQHRRSEQYQSSARSHRQLRNVRNIKSENDSKGYLIPSSLHVDSLHRSRRSLDFLGKKRSHDEHNSNTSDSKASEESSHDKRLSGLLSGLGNAISEGVEATVNATQHALEEVSDTLQKPLEGILNTTDSEENNSTEKTGLLDLGLGILNKAQETLSDVGEKLHDQLSSTLNSTQEHVHDLSDNIQGAFNNISDSSDNNRTFGGIFSGIGQSLLNATSQIQKSISDAGHAIGDQLGSAVNLTHDLVGGVVDTIHEPLDKLASGIGLNGDDERITTESPLADSSVLQCVAHDWMWMKVIAVVATIYLHA